jgi:hypothetical protein
VSVSGGERAVLVRPPSRMRSTMPIISSVTKYELFQFCFKTKFSKLDKVYNKICTNMHNLKLVSLTTTPSIPNYKSFWFF